jgi:hypothetical protein
MREFSEIINDLAKKNLNIAMMKLCFVDINNSSNIHDIFQSYNLMIDSLRKNFPDIIIIHFTVPLKSEPSLLNKIKDIIKGRRSSQLSDNLARKKYNALLLSRYSKEDIFDIAEAESTYPNGERAKEMVNGEPCYFLIKDYTDDGGHLNQKGQLIIAEKLIEKIYERFSSLK